MGGCFLAAIRQLWLNWGVTCVLQYMLASWPYAIQIKAKRRRSAEMWLCCMWVSEVCLQALPERQTAHQPPWPPIYHNMPTALTDPQTPFLLLLWPSSWNVKWPLATTQAHAFVHTHCGPQQQEELA